MRGCLLGLPSETGSFSGGRKGYSERQECRRLHSCHAGNLAEDAAHVKRKCPPRAVVATMRTLGRAFGRRPQCTRTSTPRPPFPRGGPREIFRSARFSPVLFFQLVCNRNTLGAMSIGNRIQAWRQAVGETLQVAASRLGVSASTLNRWERGESEPTGLYRTKIEKVLAAHDKMVDALLGKGE